MMEAISEADQIGEVPAALPIGPNILSLVEQGHLDVLQDRELGYEIVGLKYEPDSTPSSLRELVVGHLRHVFSAKPILASRRPVQAAGGVETGGFYETV